jgi:hypothetical protein
MKIAAAAKLGIDGEKKINNWLKELLPEENYKIYKDKTIPEHQFDIDFIIVGPKGIIVLEAKNYSDKVCFYGDEYFQIKDGRKYVMFPDNDPRQQIKKHVYCLRKYFEQGGFYSLKISQSVIFPETGTVDRYGAVGVYIIVGQVGLKKYLDSLDNLPEYTPEYCKKINQYLGTGEF